MKTVLYENVLIASKYIRHGSNERLEFACRVYELLVNKTNWIKLSCVGSCFNKDVTRSCTIDGRLIGASRYVEYERHEDLDLYYLASYILIPIYFSTERKPHIDIFKAHLFL